MTVRAAIINTVVIMGIISSLFGCTRKPDPDEAVIVQLQKAGSDLSKPHTLDFYLYFPSQSAAEQAATRMRQTGYAAEVKTAAKGNDWLCLGTKKVIPELSTIQGITRDLNALARSLQGDYDGWEAKVENDLPTKGLSQ
jgi:regulator of RNase E activity RraB